MAGFRLQEYVCELHGDHQYESAAGFVLHFTTFKSAAALSSIKSRNQCVRCPSSQTRARFLYAFESPDFSLGRYNLFTGALVRRLRGHYGTVKTCLFHPDLEEVYSGSQDSEVLVWSPRFDWAERPNSRRLSSSRTEDHEALDEWSN